MLDKRRMDAGKAFCNGVSGRSGSGRQTGREGVVGRANGRNRIGVVTSTSGCSRGRLSVSGIGEDRVDGQWER